MSDAPTQLSTIHRPLKAAVDGVFDPRLVVSKAKLSSDADISEATLTAYVGAVHGTPYHGSAPALSVADFMSGEAGRGLSPDSVVLIYRDGDGDDPNPQVLMRGFAEVPEYVERGQVGGSEAGGSFVVSSVLKRQNKLASSQVYGRYMRNSSSIDAWRAGGANTQPLGDDDDVVHVSARPCTFNARGEANRHPAPITVSVDGRSELVYVFSDDDDPGAQPWTWAQALRYLLYFHCDLTAGLIGWSNVWDQTQTYINKTYAERPTPPVYESPDYDGRTFSKTFQYAMLGMPSDAVLDGHSLVEAMAIVAEATDTHFRVQTWCAGQNVGDDLLWWARGGGRQTEVCKYPRGDTVAEILESLNIEQMVLSSDYGDVITMPIGVGAVRKHEVTVPLVPGWAPDANVDRPADVDAAIAASEAHIKSSTPQNDPWFQKYHTAGSDFVTYAKVGRRWVLNETGRYKASEYARASGYFVASKYGPWAPASCSIIERTFVNGQWAEEPADWTRAPRPFQNCFSADASKRSLGIVVEASFDGGAKWERIECTVINTEAGIYLDVDDLTQRTSIYDTTLHWWKAMCKDQARIRVTAVIDSDHSLFISRTASRAAVRHQSARMYDWRERFVSNYRTSANSIFAPGGAKATQYQTVECRDDSIIMDQWISSLTELNATRRIPATFTIPWLEFTRYKVGDCVTQIRGVVVLEGAAVGGVRRPPDILSIIYSNTSTQLVLDDPGMAEMK